MSQNVCIEFIIKYQLNHKSKNKMGAEISGSKRHNRHNLTQEVDSDRSRASKRSSKRSKTVGVKLQKSSDFATE